jgi:hypothetical protein
LYGDYSVSLSVGYQGLDLGVVANNSAINELGNFGFNQAALADSYDITSLGDFAFASSTVAGSHFLYSFGSSSFQNSYVTNCFALTALGPSVFATATNMDSWYVTGVGAASFEEAKLTRVHNITAIGPFGCMSFAALTDSMDIFGLGYETLYGANLNQATSVFAAGDVALASAVIQNGSSNITAVGPRALAGSWIDGASQNILALGGSALESSALVGSSDVVAIGTEAGRGLYGTVTNVVMIGAGTTVTNSNDFVIGNSSANYFLPGQSLNTGGYLTTGGETNRWIFKSVTETPSVTNITINVNGKDYTFRAW